MFDTSINKDKLYYITRFRCWIEINASILARNTPKIKNRNVYR